MTLIKCRDGVHRPPLSILDYADPVFASYEEVKEVPAPARRVEPTPAPEGVRDVRW